MGFRSFRLNVVLRVFLLAATLLGLLLLLAHTTFYATAAIAFLVLCLEIVALVRYVERTSGEVSRFLQAIRYGDFSSTFTGGSRGRIQDELRSAFNEVMEQFRRTRHEAEEQAQYLETVVQHIGVGFLSYRPDGTVVTINTAAKRLLQVSHLANIHALSSLSPDFVSKLLALKSGDHELLRIDRDHETLQLTVATTELRMRDQQLTLVSFQNIRNELEEKEMDAWQNLIRVLTHEIMNSITPISSLASTLNEMLSNAAEPEGGGLAEGTVEDVRSALQTIEKRSQGLLRFVDAYRNLTHIPRPRYTLFSVAEFLRQVEQLMKPQLAGQGIAFSTSVVPESLELVADRELVEQVLINLLLNAAQALEGRPGGTMAVRACLDKRGRVAIEVADNGPGIVGEALEKIFVPFYTTKKQGSGIGLSLSRQIMRLHKGTITVRSEPGQETVFTIQF